MTEERTCTVCGDTKPMGDFYKNALCVGGRLGQCKPCVRARVKAHRSANIERVQEYDRNRPNAKERSLKCVKSNREKYKKSPAFRASVCASKAKWESANTHKRKANTIVGNALRSGSLKRLPCEVCRTTKEVQAHHEDYRFPMDVRWLCKTHHGARHREINAAMRAGVEMRHKGFSLEAHI